MDELSRQSRNLGNAGGIRAIRILSKATDDVRRAGLARYSLQRDTFLSDAFASECWPLRPTNGQPIIVSSIAYSGKREVRPRWRRPEVSGE